jgi:branched-chain amino acid transport system permease protein
MDFAFFLIQLLNGLQYGLLLFLVASGLTLVFGIMGIINLAHGSFYMVGAYLAWSLASLTGSLTAAILLAIPLTVVLGMALERLLFRHLYQRDHLYQVLLTYGLILVFEELRSLIWGDDVHGVAVPDLLNASIPLTDNLSYPVYRLAISGVCLLLAAALYFLIQKTRLGMMIRAGASNRDMVQSLGIDIKLIYTLVFALGIALAAFAGMINAPLSSVFPNMGSQVLIICFVVVVIGGIGSVKGAMAASLMIGLAETFGQVLVPEVAGMLVYVLMAIVLVWRPQGLFGRSGDEFPPHSASTLARARPAGPVPAGGEHFLHAVADQGADHGHLRHEPRSAGRLHRPGQLRPCRLLRSCRLCAGLDDAEVRGGQPVVVAAGGDRRLCAVCADHRHAGAAHARHLLHHGHAGLRTDAVLRLSRHQARWRIRWRLHLRQARHEAG